MPIGTLSAMVLAGALAAGPVRTYTREVDPSRSEGLRSGRAYLPIADPRPGDALLTPAPWPDNRTDSPDRVQNGRLWHPRVQVGTRSPLAELPRGEPGAASFGAPPEANDEVIFVRSSLRLPIVAISPFTDLDERTTDEIERNVPMIGRTQTRFRSPQILHELREAQHQWLREQGYILRVRTHVNPATLAPAPVSEQAPAEEAEGMGEGEPQSSGPEAKPEPRAVIRVRERSTEPPAEPMANAQTPARDQ